MVVDDDTFDKPWHTVRRSQEICRRYIKTWQDWIWNLHVYNKQAAK